MAKVQATVTKRRKRRRKLTEAQMITQEARLLRKLMRSTESTRVRRLRRLGLEQ